jgi:hypothetical protein
VTFTGTTGTWTDQSANLGDPYSWLFALDSASLSLLAGSDEKVTGLLTPAGQSIYRISTGPELSWGQTFSFTSGYRTPGEFLSDQLGTFDLTAGSFRMVDALGNSAIFSPTSIRIFSAVPEPSSYAVILGFAVLGFGFGRRRSDAAV